ncbi:MAG: LysE family transporter [Anaerolineales bacterium]|nr:LysE family transporter [Anaerolineales bacterium]
MLTYFVQGLLLGFPASAQPGPFQAYLLSQVSRNGWRRTLPAALAPLLSDGPIILLVLLFLTQLPPQALNVIQVVGGVFILYLAWGAVQAFRTAVDTTNPIAPEDDALVNQSIWKAALMNFLNPNPFVFWGTVGGIILLEAWAISVWHAVAFLVGLYGTLIGGFAFFIVLFGTVGRLDPRINRGLSLVSAVALVLFGLWQLWSGLTPLLG